jgi:hypothetical protein
VRTARTQRARSLRSLACDPLRRAASLPLSPLRLSADFDGGR